MKTTLKRTLLTIGGLLLVSSSAAHAQTIIRMEAEDMTLDTYRVEVLDFASDGALINLTGPGIAGSATAPFPGARGDYDLSVIYHDESDGLAQLSLTIDGEMLDSWMLDIRGFDAQPQVVNRRTRLIGTGISVTGGDVVRIGGVQGNWDHANVDYIEFVVSGQSGPNTLPTEIVGFYTASQARIEIQPGEYGGTTSWCDQGDIAISGGLVTRVLNPQSGTNSPDFYFRMISFSKLIDGGTGLEGWSISGVNESLAPLIADVRVSATCADRDF